MVGVTQTQPTDTSRSPEYRLAQNLVGGLRRELFHSVSDYRPLPPLDPEHGPLGFLPRWMARRTTLLPHAAVAVCAVIVFASGYFHMGSRGLVPFVYVAAPTAVVLLTLIRPVFAFWASLVVAPVVGVVSGFGGGWPWTPNTLAAHTVVVVVAAARTTPRAAGWMWLITAGYALFAEMFLGVGRSSDTVPLLFLTAIGLLVVTLFQTRTQARREVTAQRTVTAAERSKRTLLEERTTIARELHDVVAHHMSVVAIQAEAAPYRVENPPPELEQAFLTIRENAVAALTELRRILGVVRAEDYEAPDAPQPTLADLPGLLANVREAGLDVTMATTGAVRELPQGVELSAYRIVQEALSNVLRHAPGAEAKVEVGYVLGGLGLRVANGPARGLVKPSPGAGHGLTGMRERVTMLDGQMTAEPAEDGGYEVTVFLPVRREGTEQ
ncbi:sensor histidine kinase [Streptomyces termitum]|uniref:sensor histidine kinase n=1 Tax=Streptomyces termitum TaxID=67368 RepID=UPI0033BA08B3